MELVGDTFGNRLQQMAYASAPTQDQPGSCANSTATYSVSASYNLQNQMVSTNAPGFTVNMNNSQSYDGAGDVAYDGRNQYLYDADGRICAASTLSGMIGYMYDAAGNRVAKGTITSMSCDLTANGFTQTEGYVVGPSGEQLTEVDANNNWKHTNVYAAGKLIGTYDAYGLHFHIDDPLGTRRVQVDASGLVEAVYQSLPFGDGYVEGSSPGVSDPTENHFTGKERDTESGNDYFMARYYGSSTGRFLSPDPSQLANASLADPQSLNLYSYVGNNPLGFVDPMGLSPTGVGCTVPRQNSIWVRSRRDSPTRKAFGERSLGLEMKAFVDGEERQERC